MHDRLRLVSRGLLAAFVVAQSLISSPIEPAAAFHATGQDPHRINRPTSEPYTGDLSIFEDSGRAEKLQINRVMDILRIKQGSNVADIGAGSGWFTTRAARRVGTAGKVFAVEINPEFLKYIRDRAVDEKLTNIQTVLGKEDDPLLPRGSLDAVLILKTYHEIAQPILVLAHLREAMKPDALMGIIDRNGNGKDHGINRKVVIKEAAEAGFALVEQYDFVKPDGMDYFLVFHAAAATTSH
ncbi:MAG TPA: class I SAM-dependent methyltransferase [Blastocatellia bacterium]|nr:class I SAM-dependent methyltransferase [Blastocatellia bacterium]